MGQVELIWGAFSLMILGALISMCMKCQQIGSKQEKANVDNQRTQCEDQQDCDERSYLSSVSRQSQMKGTCHTPNQSKSRKLSSFNDLETCSKSRFQNLTTEIQTEEDSTYITIKDLSLARHLPLNPSLHIITTTGKKSQDYQVMQMMGSSQGVCSYKDQHGMHIVDDNSHGYQNVIGTIKSSRCDEDIYENNLAIQIWKQVQISESDSANCEEESIYINTEQYSSSQRRDVHF